MPAKPKKSMPLLDRLTWAQCIFYIAISAAWCSTTSFLFDHRTVIPFSILCISSLVLWKFYIHRRDEKLAAFCMNLAQLCIVVFAGIVVSYAAFCIGYPYQDERLAGYDAALGFNWMAFVHTVDKPLPALLLNAAYGTIHLQLVILLFCLSYGGYIAHLRKFTAAFTLTLSVTLLVSICVPAKAYYAFLNLSDASFHYYSVDYYWRYLQVIEALRHPAAQGYGLEGIITFPSFHAAAALLFIWGFWRVPFARYPALVLNLLMLISTLPVGGHYLVDVLAGTANAILCIVLIGKIDKSSVFYPEELKPALSPAF